MKFCIPLVAATALLAACAPGGPGGFIDSDVERGIAGAAIGYGTARAINGNGDRGAILGGLAGVFCDDVGGCSPSR